MIKNSKLASSNRATVLSAVVALITICAIRPNTGAAEVIQTAQGAIQGSEADGTEKFLGVPYAAPPVGDPRWTPPQPHASWSGVLNATELGSHCAQTARVVGTPSRNEDCLFLNVYVPATQRGIETRERAVMVWIHGGAFTAGESDDFDASDLPA
jgi:para-nitrobenzyl esterase